MDQLLPTTRTATDTSQLDLTQTMYDNNNNIVLKRQNRIPWFLRPRRTIQQPSTTPSVTKIPEQFQPRNQRQKNKRCDYNQKQNMIIH